MQFLSVIFHGSEWYRMDITTNQLEIGLPRDSANVLITYQSSDLIRSLMLLNNRRPLPSIVDLQSLDKQMSQEGKEFRNDKPWKLTKMLKYHSIMADDHRFGAEPIKEMLEFMGRAFQTLLNKDVLEKERFEDIEIPINTIIYKRQSEGISFDNDEAQALCTRLERLVYYIKNELQFKYQIYDPDNVQEQLAYLTQKNYRLIKSPIFTFKARRNDDPVCKLFYEMLRAQQDLNSVLYMIAHWGGTARCYPIFFGFGTITSRITVREPALQNLRKSNRAIIVPDRGKKLLYVDYSQFEAGILASLSDDPLLLKLYETDIYEDLAKVVLGDKKKRADAKVLFYRYMYGDTTLNSATMRYFQRFRKMVNFKAAIDAEMLEHRRVGTDSGNYRFGNGEDHGWSLSHKIQATASLIYKNAVIRVQKEVISAKFLIPMHDATLYQIEDYRYLAVKIKIENIYKEEFQKVCPKLTPSVTSTDKFS